MKKILFVCQHYYPEKFGITSVCEELAKKGYQIDVLTGLPNYHLPKNKVPEKYKHSQNRREKINGVNVIRCHEIGRRKGLIFLCLNYLSFWRSSLKMVKNLDDDYDLVVCYQYSPVTMSAAGVKYAKEHNKKVLLYCFDLWPESLKTYHFSEKHPLFIWLDKISKNIYKNCDKILVSSQPFIEYFENHHKIPTKKLSYLPQYSEDYGDLIPEDIKDDGKIHFLYAGNIGKMQNLSLVTEAVSQIQSSVPFVVDIVGSGSDFTKVNSSVRRRHLEDKIIFHGEKNQQEILPFYAIADALILTMRDNGSYIGKTLPLKLQSYMSTGKPIIASANGAAKDIINKHKCGYCAPANNPKAFANLLQIFLDKQPELTYKTNPDFYLKNNVKKLIQHIESL